MLKNKLNIDNIDFVVKNIYNFDINEKFDLVFFNGVLHHLGDPNKAIEIASEFADEMIIVEPNGYSPALKIIEKASKYHREHEEQSFFLFTINKWLGNAGMKIKKYKKDKSNKYKVLIDDEEITLYDDIIIKYNLLMKSEIDVSTYNEMIKENTLLLGYYEAIKYITKKMRSKKEIEEYLIKNGYISTTLLDFVLRTETAGIVALSMINYEIGR